MKELKKVLESYIAEDAGRGDITTDSTIPKNLAAKAAITAKEKCILAGLEETAMLFGLRGVEAHALRIDGKAVDAGTEVMRLQGSARAILTLERTALNILGRMSSVATLAKELHDKAKAVNPNVRVVGTRKTVPGFRLLDKKAVKLATGHSHRAGLWDAVLIKDNHLKLVSIENAIGRAKKTGKKVEIEARNAVDAVSAARAGADSILLDNMGAKQAADAIEAIRKEGLRKKVEIEVSGGITPENMQEFARLGVDVISSGYPTRNARILDFKLRIL